MKEKDVSRAHQCDLGHVRGFHPFPPALHGKIPISVRMVLRNFQAERKELHHTILVDLHEPSVLCGKYQRRGVAKIYKAEMSIRMDFTVQHSRDFARILIRIPSQGISCRDRQGQPEIDLLEKPWRCLSASIKLRKHKAMKRV